VTEHASHELESRPQSRREWSGWFRSLVLPIALLIAIVAGLLIYQSMRGSDAADDDFGIVALPQNLNTTGAAPAALEGRAAPDFLLESLAGDELRLSDFRGRPVIVNFWATWCGPCRAEMPELVESYLEHRDAGLAIVAVNQREAPDRIRPFADEFGLPFPIALDRRGEVGAAWQIGGAMEGLPSSYFIDRDGVVRKVVLGPLTPRHLEDGLSSILGRSN
jgi:peroxiredoxin